MSPLVSVLLPFAIQQGLPLLTKVLEGKIGAGNAALVESVVKTVADKAGVTVESLVEVAASSPATIQAAVEEAELDLPEMLELYLAGLAHQTTIMVAEHREPWFAWAWRPFWMWFLAVLWGWNTIVLHSINAWLKIALPPMDFVTLLQLTLVIAGFYMGGHTIKDAVDKFTGMRAGAK